MAGRRSELFTLRSVALWCFVVVGTGGGVGPPVLSRCSWTAWLTALLRAKPPAPRQRGEMIGLDECAGYFPPEAVEAWISWRGAAGCDRGFPALAQRLNGMLRSPSRQGRHPISTVTRCITRFASPNRSRAAIRYFSEVVKMASAFDSRPEPGSGYRPAHMTKSVRTRRIA